MRRPAHPLHWSAILIACLSVVLSAQQPRDTATSPRTGTASIAGVITSDDTPSAPIARAIVTLTGGGLSPGLTTIADAAGRFTFAALPPGAYTLTASKSPYLPMSYGQVSPGHGSGVPVSLSEGQQLTGLTWKLARAGVISGRVLDDSGRPMSGAPIVLMQYRMTNGERMLASTSCCVWPTTDGGGMFRVYGVLPGDYIVSALPPGDYVFIPSGPWQARNEARQVTGTELRWAEGLVAESERSASPSTTQMASPPDPGPTVAYGRVFFPGTTDDSQATPITIRRGEERGGIDFAMHLQPTARVEGRIISPDGQPVTSGASLSYGGATMTAANGLISLKNLLPGRYTIVARAPGLFASRDVDVNGRDVTGLEWTLATGATMSGKVVFESASGAAPPNPSTVRITPRALQPVGPPARPLNGVGADGTFTLPGLDPGRYRLSATITTAPGAPASASGTTWALKSAMVNGRDAADVPFDMSLGDRISDVVITFTDRATELSGTLFDANARPAPGYYVVVFPTDESMWAQGSRRLPAPVRSATNGGFRFAGLPAGTYSIAAYTGLDAPDLTDAALLKQLAASATTVTLADGEKKQQDLKFATGR